MIPAQRRKAILAEIERRGVVSIAELSDRFLVSHMTVRRDIQHLENQGWVVHTSGGAQLAERFNREPTRSVKKTLQAGEKAAIAKRAAVMVPNEATVYLDAGTTCLALAVELADRHDLTVVTNDFAISAFLAERSQCTLYHTGGLVLRENESCVGDSAARFIEGINVHLAFISAPSWDAGFITSPTENKVPVKRAIVASSANRVLLSDSSKYGKSGFFRAVPLTDLHTVITDDGLPPTARKLITRAGTELLLVRRPTVPGA